MRKLNNATPTLTSPPTIPTTIVLKHVCTAKKQTLFFNYKRKQNTGVDLSIRVLSANARDPPSACGDAGGVEAREGAGYVRGDEEGAVVSEGDARGARDC